MLTAPTSFHTLCSLFDLLYIQLTTSNSLFIVGNFLVSHRLLRFLLELDSIHTLIGQLEGS